MHAIGHEVHDRFPRKRVVYLTSEQFTNEVIASIQTARMGEFRTKYRTVDVLLIDDIQFLAGKDRTKEEFFHTFNALHEINKQIVISSDRPPKEIAVEDRLRSRLEQGLLADIQPPDFETRLAIEDMKGKRRDKHIVFPRQVAMYIVREETPSSLPVIGQAFGGRDHTTALHSIDKIANELKEDERLRYEVQAIRERLYADR